jgi:hypothetical protein
MKMSKILRSAAVLGAVMVLGAAALNAGGVDAARGGNKGGGQTTTASIKLDQADPHLGDWVTFTTSGGSKIQVACYGLGLEVIYAADQPTGTAFLLGGTSSEWLSRGGSSECYAWLIGRDMTKIFAVTTFVAGGAR